ncbi:MAG: 50S ribosomal protein L22 [Candidatus Omnitrophica bacterium]|nr:50S ribosomal protein L22 [Candidatus Omnitrophota bacterium]
MIARARVQFVRISPRKVRYVIDLIRKKKVSEAQAILNGSPRRAGGILQKLLRQAVDAAKKNSQVEAAHLVISKVLADGGPSMRRFRAASMGRASVIHKRTSHITLELDLIRKTAPVSPKGPAQKPAVKKAAESPSGRRKMAGAK